MMTENFYQLINGLNIENFNKEIQAIAESAEDPIVELGLVRYQLILLLKSTIEQELSQGHPHPYANFLQKIKEGIS